MSYYSTKLTLLVHIENSKDLLMHSYMCYTKYLIYFTTPSTKAY